MLDVIGSFYDGIFYPNDSPLYEPNEDSDRYLYGSCFATVGQPENYRGFLHRTTTLLADNYFYA